MQCIERFNIKIIRGAYSVIIIINGFEDGADTRKDPKHALSIWNFSELTSNLPRVIERLLWTQLIFSSRFLALTGITAPPTMVMINRATR